jgi:ABC-type dipeptide/oligopeptide/nickel transport system ATPase subunit
VYRNLQYFVPVPGKHKKDESGKRPRLELLKSISGATVPGQLTALMGGSGAGKVSLPLAPARSETLVVALRGK